jgi:hypothetical protein
VAGHQRFAQVVLRLRSTWASFCSSSAVTSSISPGFGRTIQVHLGRVRPAPPSCRRTRRAARPSASLRCAGARRCWKRSRGR